MAVGPEKMGGVMKRPDEQNQRIDLLRELLECFDAPDLTLVEAKALRSRLADLLEPEVPTDAGARPRRMPSVRVEEREDALRLTVSAHCRVG